MPPIYSLESLKSKIKYILGFATWMFTVLCIFVVSPPLSSAHLNEGSLRAIANILVAIIAITFLNLFKRTLTSRLRKRIIIACWLLLIFSGVSTYLYNTMLDNNTVEWPLGRKPLHVVGINYTSDFVSLLRKKNLDPEAVSKQQAVLLFAPQNSTELTRIWYDDDIQKNGLKIALLFLLNIMCYTCLLLLLTYTIDT